MRAISLVDRLEFDFLGNVVRSTVTLGDVDNDGRNELVVGNENGDLVIFKEKEKWQSFKDLGFISCVGVGDVLNQNRNCLVVVTADGWCYIYGSCEDHFEEEQGDNILDVEQVDGQIFSGESIESPSSDLCTEAEKKDINQLQCIHTQRIPANCKDILLADVDGDGLVEMVVGLTDRVVRSYRWYSMASSQKPAPHMPDSSKSDVDKLPGKLVGLSKWECANQIGSITLHHSGDGKPSLLIAQPGGTFMRIRCVHEENASQGSHGSNEHISMQGLQGSSIDYQFLGLSRMRNQNISTEIVGNLKIIENMNLNSDTESDEGTNDSTKSANSSDKIIVPKGNPYAVATLDGTIMLVQDEIILWAIAVDHQVFALTKLDVTENGADDIVACAWDGQTYILDQHKNTVRFQLGEAVQAFESGYYGLSADEPAVTCFVYVTFKNKIYVYYKIPLKEMILRKFEPDLENVVPFLIDSSHGESALSKENLSQEQRRKLVEYLLYGIKN